jgi:hypothetical protein
MGATLARLHRRMDPRRFFASRGMDEGYASWLAKGSGGSGVKTFHLTHETPGSQRKARQPRPCGRMNGQTAGKWKVEGLDPIPHREFGARTRDALDEAIRRAMDLIDGVDAAAWFAHCGYSGQLK